MCSNQLNLVAMGKKSDPAAGRTLEIFLDFLVAMAPDTHSYLLTEGYEEALTDAEKSLREKLHHLSDYLSNEEIASSRVARLPEMFAELGAQPTSS